jgi:hypothetical protein
VADKTIQISIAGPEEVIDPSLDSFVGYHGWAAEVFDGENWVGNTETREQCARRVIRQFIIDCIKAQSAIEAQALAAEQARQAVDGAIDLTTMTLDVV